MASGIDYRTVARTKPSRWKSKASGTASRSAITRAVFKLAKSSSRAARLAANLMVCWRMQQSWQADAFRPGCRQVKSHSRCRGFRHRHGSLPLNRPRRLVRRWIWRRKSAVQVLKASRNHFRGNPAASTVSRLGRDFITKET